MILSTKINNIEKFALNEIVISRGSYTRIFKFEIYVNDIFVNTYSADGILISTPTGSTAYNLSAGGPIIDPKNEMMIVTPICPHSFYTRSIVLSSEDFATIKINNISDDILLTLDGQNSYKVNNDIVNIKKSKNTLKLIKTIDMNFFEILRKKLSK